MYDAIFQNFLHFFSVFFSTFYIFYASLLLDWIAFLHALNAGALKRCLLALHTNGNYEKENGRLYAFVCVHVRMCERIQMVATIRTRELKWKLGHYAGDLPQINRKKRLHKQTYSRACEADKTALDVSNDRFEYNAVYGYVCHKMQQLADTFTCLGQLHLILSANRLRFTRFYEFIYT